MEGLSNEEEKRLRALLSSILPHFMWRPSVEEACAEFDAAAQPLAPSCREVAMAFRHSLASTLSTVKMPFTLAERGTFERRLGVLFLAAKIEIGGQDLPDLGEGPEAAKDRKAREQASTEMREFAQSEHGAGILLHDALAFLRDSLDQELQRAAHELLQQGLVLLWSAFEVLCRDTFEVLLNEDPSKIGLHY
jgi:hypothetical protein